MILAVMLLSQIYNIIMAKENSAVEAQGAQAVVEVVKELVAPKIVTLHGTVVMVSDWRKGSDEDGATFKHDTRIVTLSNLKDGVTHDVFITRSQWKEYGCEQVMYAGNAVTVSLEDCVKDVTGYKATAKSEVLTPHTSSYKAFNKVIMLDDIQMLAVLEERGVSFNGIQFIMNKLATARLQHDIAVQQKATANSGEANSLF